MASASTILLAIVLASFVASSYQLQCYECTEGGISKFKKVPLFSKNLNADCGTFTDSVIVTCPTATQVCQKVVGEMSGESAAVHGCGTTSAACDAVDGSELNGVSMSCYSCDADKCNSATGIAAATSLLALSLIAAAFY